MTDHTYFFKVTKDIGRQLGRVVDGAITIRGVIGEDAFQSILKRKADPLFEDMTAWIVNYREHLGDDKLSDDETERLLEALRKHFEDAVCSIATDPAVRLALEQAKDNIWI